MQGDLNTIYFETAYLQKSNEKIKEDIFIKLLPMFIRFKTEKKLFEIKINDNFYEYQIISIKEYNFE